jgi:hypothetical protein
MEETVRQFTYTATQEIIRKANQRYWVRTHISKKLIVDFLIIALFFYFWISGDRSWAIGAMGMSIVIYIFVHILTYFVPLRRSLQRLSNMNSKGVTVKLDEKCLSVRSDLGLAELPWTSIKKIWKYTDLWLLFPAGGVHFTFPVAALNEETQAFITNQVLKNGGEIS